MLKRRSTLEEYCPTPRLRDEKAGPPEEGWEFSFHTNPDKPEDDVYGWTPRFKMPVHPIPLPNESPASPTDLLAGQFARLAVIHDRYLASDGGFYNPCQPALLPDEKSLPLAMLRHWRGYSGNLARVHGYDPASMEIALAAVRADLVKMCKAGEPPVSQCDEYEAWLDYGDLSPDDLYGYCEQWFMIAIEVGRDFDPLMNPPEQLSRLCDVSDVLSVAAMGRNLASQAEAIRRFELTGSGMTEASLAVETLQDKLKHEIACRLAERKKAPKDSQTDRLKAPSECRTETDVMQDLTIDLPEKAVPLTQQQFENVGAEVERLCLDAKNLARVRERVERCRQLEITYEKECHKAIRRANKFEGRLREKYAAEIAEILSKERLRCSRPYDPDDPEDTLGPGYTWQKFAGVPQKCGTRDGVMIRPMALAGWVKPHKKGDFKRPVPKLPPSPLSLWVPPLEKNDNERILRDATPKPQGEVLLLGYYTLLAAIHDRFYDKRVTIIDRAGKEWPTRMAYGLITDVGGCPDVKQCEVEMALGAVQADLAKIGQLKRGTAEAAHGCRPVMPAATAADAGLHNVSGQNKAHQSRGRGRCERYRCRRWGFPGSQCVSHRVGFGQTLRGAKECIAKKV